MANDIDQILVGIPDVAGGVLIAPDEVDKTAYPEDAVTAPDASFVPAGFVSEDGVTESNTRNVEKVRAWGGQVVRAIQQDYETTYSFSFLQFKNKDILETVYGADNVSVTGGKFQIKKNAKVLGRRSWMFEMQDGDTHIRLFVPNGQITEVGDIQYDHRAAIQLQVTLEAFPDEDGNNAYLFMDEGADDPVTP